MTRDLTSKKNITQLVCREMTRQKSLLEIQSSITDCSFVRRKGVLRLRYRMHDRWHHIVKATPLEIAQFLMRSGKIDRFAIIDETVVMYKKAFDSSLRQGEIVMTPTYVKFFFTDIDFTPQEIQWIAAKREYAKVARIMFPRRAKILPMGQFFHQSKRA